MQEAARRKLDHESCQEAHDKEGGNRVDGGNEGQVLNPEPLEKGRFCKIIEENPGSADEKEKRGRPKKYGDFFLVDLKPPAQKTTHGSDL